MGVLLGVLIGVITYFCISRFMASGKCDAPENCCKHKRWLYLIPIIIIILLIAGFWLMGPGFMSYCRFGPGMGPGMGRPW